MRDVMSTEVNRCFDDQIVSDAARIMAEKHVRRLLVLNHDEQMVGILALGDFPRRASHELSTEAIIDAFDEYYGWSKRT